MTKLRPAAIAISWLLALSRPAHAGTAEYDPPPGQVKFRVLGATGGLRNHPTASIAQDPHGLPCLGTEGGVYRFDGEDFAHFPQETYVAGIGPDSNTCDHFEVRARVGASAWAPATALPLAVLPAGQARWFLVAIGLIIAAAITWRQRTVLGRRTRQLHARSAASFLAVIDLMPDLISLYRDRDLIYLNLASRRFLGLDDDDERWKQLQLATLIHPDDRAQVADLFHRVRELEPGASAAVLEVQMRGASDTWRRCEISANCVEIGGALTVVASGRDITERKRMRAQLLRRSEREHLAPLALAGVLEAAIHLTGNELRQRAELVRELGPVPRVVADDGRLTQVFINLLVNAAHALPEGHSATNRITVRTRTDAYCRAVVEIQDTGPGMPPAVQARVFDPCFTTTHVGEDTGPGLSICHGIISGLGGQIAIHSAQGHGTTVRVVLPAYIATDEPTIVFAPTTRSAGDPPTAVALTTTAVPTATEPAVEQTAAVEPDSAVAPAFEPTAAVEPTKAVAPSITVEPTTADDGPRRHRVMLVDDEPKVTRTMERLLRRDYDVTLAGCGRDAIDLITRGARFDAIVSDVMMPNMTGIELIEELQRIAPDQADRLVFLSGGPFTAQTRARLDQLGAPQLEKPIAASELCACVKRIATEPPASIEWH